MTKDELSICRHADILSCNPENLVDLNRVEIAVDLPISNRMKYYMDQVQNPYLFRLDDLIVKVTFAGKRDLSSILAGLMTQN